MTTIMVCWLRASDGLAFHRPVTATRAGRHGMRYAWGDLTPGILHTAHQVEAEAQYLVLCQTREPGLAVIDSPAMPGHFRTGVVDGSEAMPLGWRESDPERRALMWETLSPTPEMVRGALRALGGMTVREVGELGGAAQRTAQEWVSSVKSTPIRPQVWMALLVRLGLARVSH